MKIFKFIIIGFACAIVALVAIFGVQTDTNTIEITKAIIDSEPVTTTTQSTPKAGKPMLDENGQVKIPSLSEAEKAALPAFVLALPKIANDGDENGNWIRDDIELFIAYKFPYSPRSRATYIQMAKILDRIGTDSGQTKTARQITLWKDEQYARKCFYDTGFTDDDLAELTRLVLNNEHRAVGYQMVVEMRKEIPEHLSSTIHVPEDACDPIIWENEATIQDWVPE